MPSGKLERRERVAASGLEISGISLHLDEVERPHSSIDAPTCADASRLLATPPPLPAARRAAPRSDWATLRRLLPYLWHYRWRVAGRRWPSWSRAKVANVGVPVLLKNLVDALTLKPGDPRARAGGAGRRCCWPTALLRLSTSLFTELRELVFAKATAGAAAQHRARGVRAPARAEPALPPRAPDRRHDARHRARHARRCNR